LGVFSYQPSFRSHQPDTCSSSTLLATQKTSQAMNFGEGARVGKRRNETKRGKRGEERREGKRRVPSFFCESYFEPDQSRFLPSLHLEIGNHRLNFFSSGEGKKKGEGKGRGGRGRKSSSLLLGISRSTFTTHRRPALARGERTKRRGKQERRHGELT